MKDIFKRYESLWICVTIILIHFVLKIIYVDYNPISFDEPFSIYHSQLPPRDIITELFKGNNPPLYELMLHYWIQLGDSSAFWVRLPSVIFSAVTAGVLYLIGQKIANRRTAFIAVLVFSISTIQYTYAHEARVYTLFSLLCAVSMYFYFSWKKDQRNFHLILTVLCNALLLYTHYLSIFIPLVQGLLVVRKKKEVLNFLLYSSLTVLLCIPLIQVVLERLSVSSQSGGTWVAPSAIKEIVYGPIHFLNTKFALIPFALLLFSYLGFHWKEKITPPFYDLLLWFGIPYFLMYLISLEINPYSIPVFIDRYYFFTALPFYLFCGYIIDTLISKAKLFFAPLAAVLVLIVVFFNTIHPTHNRRPDLVAEFVTQSLKNEEIVVISPLYYNLNFAYHFNRDIFSSIPEKNLNKKLKNKKIYFIQDQDELLSLLKQHATLIYLEGKSIESILPTNSKAIKIDEHKPLDEYIKVYQLTKV